MIFQDSTPNLMVRDVKKTIDFYTTVLGFTLVNSVPLDKNNFVFALVRCDHISFMFQEEHSLKVEYQQLSNFVQGGGLTFYISVSDVYALFDKLRGKVSIIKEMHNTFYGSTDFAIEDCNGYILVFSQQNEVK